MIIILGAIKSGSNDYGPAELVVLYFEKYLSKSGIRIQNTIYIKQ